MEEKLEGLYYIDLGIFVNILFQCRARLEGAKAEADR